MRTDRLWRATVALLACAGAVVLLVSLTPLVRWWARALAGPWKSATGAVLVVLTGSDLEDGILGDSSYWRAVYAVLAWRTQRPAEIWISGGGRPGLSIAESMKTFLVASGVPSDAIRIEPESRSTWESAQRMSRLLAGETRPVVLLTSDYHMFRARRMFDRCGLSTLPMPVPDALKRSTRRRLRWWVFLDLLRESAAIVQAKAARRI